MTPLPPPLADEANVFWDAFEQAMAQFGRSLPPNPEALQALRTSFAFSRYVAQTCIARPALAYHLLHSGEMMRPSHGDKLSARFSRLVANDDPAGSDHKDPSNWHRLAPDLFKKQLRLFRHQEMVGIAVRDLTGRSDLDATLKDLTVLADTCIQLALDYLYQHQCTSWGTPCDNQGNPQMLVVLGMGKLGAHELNFSSDVDLIFAYPKDGTTANGVRTTSNEDFFLRLGRSLIQMVGGKTAEGFVFRVDMRLRPFGESGPLVLSFDAMEAYYQYQGREWERYAMIKARAIAGDVAAGRRLLQRLNPFVFRRYLDYNAFEALRDMKQRIRMEVQRKSMQNNIKLGAGGIREVEFFGQVFQLIRGGVQLELQVRPIKEILQRLISQGYIPDQTGSDLSRAYTFLRCVENRIQAYADQQSHNLPQLAQDRLRLACAMGFAHWDSFAEALENHRRRVHHHFNELLGADDSVDETPSPEKRTLMELSAIWQGTLEPSQSRRLFERAGYSKPEKALQQTETLRQEGALKAMSATGHHRLAKLIPLMIQAAGQAHRSQLVLQRLFDLVLTICRRTAYLSLLCEYPSALTHLVRLFEASPWIASLVNRYPALLDELLDPRTLYRPPMRRDLVQELRNRMTGIPEDDFEHQIESMRIFKQINVLRVAASDITHVLPLMKVSDHLSDIAEVILDEVVDLSWRHLVAKHGAPTCQIEGKTFRQGFAVVAYGKLGGLELGYRSDLDLVFLHAAVPGQTQGGERPIDNTSFFARLGQRVLHILSTPTAAGVLYDTDMRLRPSGDSGMLVSHIQGFRDYQLNDAWTWEHQALIRARAVTGDPEVKARFEQIRTEVLTQVRNKEKVRKEVARMRRKLRQAQGASEPGRFDIKQGYGGIVDIEFMVQYLILAHAHQNPEMVRWTDNVRLLQELSGHGLIDTETAFGLRRTYLVLRAMAHRLNLLETPAHIDDNRLKLHRALVRRCWKTYLENPAPTPTI